MFASGKCFTLINPNLLVYPINLLLWIGQESSGVSTAHLRVVELERNGQFVAEENLRSRSAGGAVLGYVVGTGCRLRWRMYLRLFTFAAATPLALPLISSKAMGGSVIIV